MFLAESPDLGEQQWGIAQCRGWGIPAPPWGWPHPPLSPPKGVQVFSLCIALFLGGGKAILSYTKMFLWLFLSLL